VFFAPNFEPWFEAFTLKMACNWVWKHTHNTRIIWNSYKNNVLSTSTGSNLMLRIKNPILKITNPMLQVWNHGLPIIIINNKWESTSIGNCWTEPTTATDWTYMHDLKYILTSIFLHLHDQKWPKIWNLHFQNLHYLAPSFIGSISFVSSQCVKPWAFFIIKRVFIYMLKILTKVQNCCLKVSKYLGECVCVCVCVCFDT
jgi:hypothetical protein